LCRELIGDTEGAAIAYHNALLKRVDDEVVRFRLENLILDLYRMELSHPERIRLADEHYEKGRFLLDRHLMNKAFLHFKRAIQLDPRDPEKRLALADLLRIRGYDERYLHQLRTIVRETLDVDTVDLNDRIEIYESRVATGLPARWNVEQYSREEETALSIPDTRSRLAVLDGFGSDYVRRSFVHPRLSLTLRGMFAFALSPYSKIEVVEDTAGELVTREDKLRRARALDAEYYLTGSVQETEDAFKLNLRIVSAENGRTYDEINTYYTGNDKIFNAVVFCAEYINQSLPLRGQIARLRGERALVNIGSSHGVEVDDVFHIIHESELRTDPETGELVLDPAETLGPGQAAEIDRVTAAYPHLADDAFVAANLDRWLS
jgi:tetratricopeptide (TPR) repeat protein